MQTKIGGDGSMNIQKPDEFKIWDFSRKTDFGIAEIRKKEPIHSPLPKYYTYKLYDKRSESSKKLIHKRQVFQEMIADISNSEGRDNYTCDSNRLNSFP